MTIQQAKEKQAELAKRYDLSWWYGTNCEKCCEVYPRFKIYRFMGGDKMFYQCEVCGKRTEAFDMPWEAREAWNNHFYKEDGRYVQISMFEVKP